MSLGAKLKLMQMSNGVYVWGMSPAKYIKEAVSNCKKHLKPNYDGRYVLIVGRFYSIQNKSIFGAPDKVRCDMGDQARPLSQV